MTDFTKLYCDLILKKIASHIVSCGTKKDKALKSSMESAQTGSGVRTMRHWRAVGDNEFYYKEIEKGYQQMKDLDELTGWSENMHQDRFKFMNDRYSEVLKKYLEVSK